MVKNYFNLNNFQNAKMKKINSEGENSPKKIRSISNSIMHLDNMFINEIDK
jgi:hypothetical protein